MSIIRSNSVLILFALTFFIMACDDHDHDEETPAADACEHMAEGPSSAVSAIEDMAGTTPTVGAEHMRSDVTLVGEPGSLGGYASLVIDESSEFGVYLDRDVPVSLWDGTGTEVEKEASSTDISECTDVQVGHTFDLEVGTYLVSFGPTAESEVRLVVVHHGEHVHE